jgi:S1-C subfamily serine protease
MRRYLGVIMLVLLTSGCATEEAQRESDQACAAQGKRAFIAELTESGALVTVSAHARYLCVAAAEIAHLPPPFDVEVLLLTRFNGVGILSVTPGSIADKAGLKANDVVTTFAGTKVARAADLQAAVALAAPGSQAVIKVRRAGRETELTAHF